MLTKVCGRVRSERNKEGGLRARSRRSVRSKSRSRSPLPEREAGEALQLTRQACQHGDLPLLRTLLTTYGAAIVTPRFGPQHFQLTCLHIAAGNGHADTVSLILQAGAEIDAEDVHGWTALMRAVSRNQVDVVNLLIQNGANLNAVDNVGQTALFIAAEFGGREMLRTLFIFGGNPTQTDKRGRTARDIALRFDKHQNAAFLAKIETLAMRQRFGALLLGTHPRLGENCVVKKLPESVLKLILEDLLVGDTIQTNRTKFKEVSMHGSN